MTRTIQQLFDLKGKTALVTGGSRGLGLQMAQALGEAGAKVMLSSRKAATWIEAAADLKAAGIDARWIAADCSKEEDIRALADEAIERWATSTSWSTTPAPPGARPPKTTRWRPGTR
jgi:NAD(P)-dependent dehydrogenase (short-subunit alcohol dehydrogenase family)